MNFRNQFQSVLGNYLKWWVVPYFENEWNSTPLNMELLSVHHLYWDRFR